MANEKRLDLIDRNVLIKQFDGFGWGGECDGETVLEAVANAPTVDAVEVVRCKDCKYREKARWHDGYRCGNPYDGMASGVELKDDDFCSYGERREGE